MPGSLIETLLSPISIYYIRYRWDSDSVRSRSLLEMDRAPMVLAAKHCDAGSVVHVTYGRD